MEARTIFPMCSTADILDDLKYFTFHSIFAKRNRALAIEYVAWTERPDMTGKVVKSA